MGATRQLWPRTPSEQGSTVIVDVGQLRSHLISVITGRPLDSRMSAWVVLAKNEREAVLELLPASGLNTLNSNQAKYWVLDWEEKVASSEQRTATSHLGSVLGSGANG